MRYSPEKTSARGEASSRKERSKFQPRRMYAGRCARILNADGDAVGTVGEVDPEVLERLGLENPVVIGELHLEKLAGRAPRLRFSLDG